MDDPNDELSPHVFSPAGTTAPAAVQPLRPPGLLQRWKSKGGILGWIASALLFLLKAWGPVLFFITKFKFLLIAAKVLLMGGSAFLSIWLESRVFGWPLAVGIVVLIFVHECGHALAARLRGIPTGIMLFIPFLGAFVTTKRYGKNLEEDAFIGIMGPVVGSIGSLICFLFYFPTANPFWLVLGQWGFLINLFNLLPTPPLDGGWIVPLFSPKLLAIGVVIAIVIGFKNPLIWLLLLASIPRIIAGWKADPKTQPYYSVSKEAKWKYGLAYLSVAGCLALMYTAIPTR